MINNRQTGRRRGRGGQRPQSGQGRPEQGNRIDNRARGNASQLHEKYKTLARDAQTQGDRVMAEYYLQFADHYFRVLSESRARFEENNPQRRQRDDAQDFDDDSEELRGEGEEAERGEEDFRQQRRDRNNNRDRGGNRDRQPRAEREEAAVEADAGERRRDDQPRAAEGEAEDADRRPRRGRRAEANGNGAGDHAAANGIEADRLPPSFALTGDAPDAGAEPEAAPKPRRGRPRKTPQAEAPAEG